MGLSRDLSRRAALGMFAAAVVAGRARAIPQERVVTLGGGVTETVYALGCADRIAAVDLTSTFPPAARAKPNVGYYRRLSAEGVLSLSPTLIIAADGAGPRETMDVLKQASVRLVALDEIHRPRDITARVRAIAAALGEVERGAALGEVERGAALADAIEQDLATLAGDAADIGRRRRALILLGGAQGGPLMAGGAQSTGALALDLIGADNAASAMTGWKPLVDEAAIALDPEAVIVMATGEPVSAEAVAAHPALKNSPAVREGRVVVADALGLVGFGPRVAHVTRLVAAQVYPEQRFRELPARAWVEASAAL